MERSTGWDPSASRSDPCPLSAGPPSTPLRIEAPERWPVARRVPPRLGARGYMLKRFPYDIVYRLVGDGELEVVAVAHHKRRPGYWAKR